MGDPSGKRPTFILPQPPPTHSKPKKPRKNRSRVERLADYLATKTDDGRVIADELIKITKDQRFRASERIRAAEVVLDRMLGRAIDVPAMMAVNALTNPETSRHAELSNAILEQLIRLPAGDLSVGANPTTDPGDTEQESDVIDVTADPVP